MTPEAELLRFVTSPQDVRRLTTPELAQLAREVRQAILDNVSQTGGHFSSNLGTVELTVAMYAAYDIPPDRVVWDTGHQAYPHKILTGRLPQFGTLRKYGGISGFLRREEHPLDSFGAGHAGTAISAALGFAMARDQLGTTEKVVAVTGDAAIASGMCWEALNHAGETQTPMAVVLNDNRMSIAPNVGALTNYLNRLRSRPHLQDLAQRAKSLLEKMPDPVTRLAAGLRHGITHSLAPEETGTIFEELGWEYIGPVDGHDIATLREIFANIRELNYPVFVHAITVKGKGYEVAEHDARRWHGVVPFDVNQCELPKTSGPVTFTQAFGSTITELAEKDPRIIAITAAMPDGTGLTEFAKRLPKQYVDTGIAESHAVTLAAGMAAGGLKPAVTIYSTFLQRAFDQILHDVCLQNLPVRFFLDRAGLVGDDGPTHHGAFDLSYLGLMPNMTILAPRDTTELSEMVRFAMAYDAGPIAVRYPRGAGDDRLPEGRSPIQLGKAEVLRRSDSATVTIAAIGSMVPLAWELAQRMDANVINLRFAKPVDVEAVAELAGRTGSLLVLEENVPRGGVGEYLRSELSGRGVRTALATLPDAFVTHGAIPLLRADLGLTADRIQSELFDGSARLIT